MGFFDPRPVRLIFPLIPMMVIMMILIVVHVIIIGKQRCRAHGNRDDKGGSEQSFL